MIFFVSPAFVQHNYMTNDKPVGAIALPCIWPGMACCNDLASGSLQSRQSKICNAVDAECLSWLENGNYFFKLRIKRLMPDNYQKVAEDIC